MPKKHVQYDHSPWSYDISLIFNFETISIYIPTGYLPFTSIHIHHNHWLVVWLPFLAFSHSDWVGISSSQLTNSIIFQKGGPTTNQRWLFHISGGTVVFVPLPCYAMLNFHRGTSNKHGHGRHGPFSAMTYSKRDISQVFSFQISPTCATMCWSWSVTHRSPAEPAVFQGGDLSRRNMGLPGLYIYV